MSKVHNLNSLSSAIHSVHLELQISATNAVNKALTIRNWLIGCYIVEYEQNGSDRIEYGSNLLAILAEKLNIKGLTAPELSRTRQFYQTYIHFLGTVSQELTAHSKHLNLGTVTQKSAIQSDNTPSQSALSLQNQQEIVVPPFTLLFKLSYSHFVELIKDRCL